MRILKIEKFPFQSENPDGSLIDNLLRSPDEMGELQGIGYPLYYPPLLSCQQQVVLLSG